MWENYEPWRKQKEYKPKLKKIFEIEIDGTIYTGYKYKEYLKNGISYDNDLTEMSKVYYNNGKRDEIFSIGKKERAFDYFEKVKGVKINVL